MTSKNEKPRLLWACIALLTFASPRMLAQNYPAESRPVALKALDGFKNFGKLQAQAAGFQPAEGPPALGEPFGVRIATLDSLRAYKPGSDPEKSLNPAVQKVIYPVLVNERLRSSITVEKTEGAWEATAIGKSNFARLLTQARSRSVETMRQDITNHFTIEIPALNMYFVAAKTEAKLKLTPIITDKFLGLTAGETMPAEVVFDKLSRLARQYNNKPM